MFLFGFLSRQLAEAVFPVLLSVCVRLPTQSDFLSIVFRYVITGQEGSSFNLLVFSSSKCCCLTGKPVLYCCACRGYASPLTVWGFPAPSPICAFAPCRPIVSVVLWHDTRLVIQCWVLIGLTGNITALIYSLSSVFSLTTDSTILRTDTIKLGLAYGSSFTRSRASRFLLSAWPHSSHSLNLTVLHYLQQISDHPHIACEAGRLTC